MSSATRHASTPRDQIYLVGEHGHVFAFAAYPEAELTSIYAILKISLTDEPITSTLNGEEYRQAAIFTRPTHTRLRHHGVKGIAFVVYPRHPLYRAISAMPAPGIVPINRQFFTRFLPRLTSVAQGAASTEEARSLFDEICQSVGELLPPPPNLDPRIAIVLERLHADYRCTTEELAKFIGVSRSQLDELFLHDAGLDIARYKLALQLGKGALHYSHGIPISELAQLIGFRDGAEYEEVFTQIHGAPPSYFVAECAIHV